MLYQESFGLLHREYALLIYPTSNHQQVLLELLVVVLVRILPLFLPKYHLPQFRQQLNHFLFEMPLQLLRF